jgi:hypothetical protein
MFTPALRRFCSYLLMGGLLATLTGCASKNPIDYLPETATYIAVNLDKLRSSEGGKRLLTAAEKNQPKPASADKLRTLYVAMDTTARPPVGYVVALGSAGFAKAAEADLKSNGATEAKMAGQTVLTSGTMTFLPIGDDGLLAFSNQAALEKMIATSKKKSPSALQSPVFKQVLSKQSSHGITIVADTAPIMGMAGGQLDGLAMMNPKGAEALKEVKSISLVLDWDAQPQAEAVLILPAEDKRADLAALVNTMLTFATTGAANSPQMKGFAGMLKGLAAQPNSEGVALALTVPKETADQWLAYAESGALANMAAGRR